MLLKSDEFDLIESKMDFVNSMDAGRRGKETTNAEAKQKKIDLIDLLLTENVMNSSFSCSDSDDDSFSETLTTSTTSTTVKDSEYRTERPHYTSQFGCHVAPVKQASLKI